jgi:hypothetical protein
MEWVFDEMNGKNKEGEDLQIPPMRREMKYQVLCLEMKVEYQRDNNPKRTTKTQTPTKEES